MTDRSTCFALAVLLGAASAFFSAQAQSLTGTQGLITVPTARMHADGTLAIGSGYVSSRHSTYQPTEARPARAYVPAYASLTLLPSVEVGFRFSRALDTGTAEALGDRMFLVRVRVLEEGDIVPAVALGAHDFLRSSEQVTAHFSALYVVASKRVVRGGPAFLRGASVHVGYGSDVFEAKAHQFVGLFGGLDVPLFQSDGGIVRNWRVLAEYDGETVTVGQRLGLGPGVNLTAGLQGFDAPIVGATWETTL